MSNLTPAQARNLSTNLKRTCQFFRFDTADDIIREMTGDAEAARLLTVIIVSLRANMGGDEYVTLRQTDRPALGPLGAAGVRGVFNRSVGQAYCWIETTPFLSRLAAALHLTPERARLLLMLPAQMDYDTYIKQSPQWAARRQEIMRRDKYTCQQCERGGGELEVHHRTQESYARLGNERDDELVTLCHECHSAIHGHKVYRKPRKGQVVKVVGT